jgi:uncharacterized protein with von Willebrand factor type A (vWA) domain
MLSDFLVALSGAMKKEGLAVAPDQLSDAARYIVASQALSPDDCLENSLKPVLVLRLEDEDAYTKAWQHLRKRWEQKAGTSKLNWYNLLKGKDGFPATATRPEEHAASGLEWAPWLRYQEYQKGGSKDRFEHAVMEALAHGKSIEPWEEAAERELSRCFLAQMPPTQLESFLAQTLSFRKEFARCKREWNKVMASVPEKAKRADKTGEKKALRPEFIEGYRANLMRWGDPNLFMRPMERLNDKEVRELQEPIREMAERLRIRLQGMRRRLSGKVDMHKTIHASQKTFGEPMRIIRTYPRRKPARWLILADVSGSVKHATQLFFSFLFELRNVLDEELRGFVFVSKVHEITQLLQEAQYDKMVSRVYLEAPIDFRGYSDYGVAFQEFAPIVEDALDRATVLLILGDARTNKRNPRLDLLQKWCSRARKVIWFNPEVADKWDQGDSVIGIYAQAVNQVYDISTPGRLIGAMEKVVI